MKTTRIMSVAAVIVAAGLAPHTAQVPGITRTRKPSGDTSIRPFKFHASEALADLRH